MKLIVSRCSFLTGFLPLTQVEIFLRNTNYPDYVYWVLVSGLVLIIVLKFSEGFSLSTAIRSFMVPNAIDQKPNTFVFSSAGILLFSLCGALSVQLITGFYDLRLLLLLSGGVLLYFILRFVLLALVGFVSENFAPFHLQRVLSKELIFVVGITLFLCNLLNVFADYYFQNQYYIPILLLGLSYLLWLVQISVQFKRGGIASLYIILYLCAFEILPLMLLFKVFIGKI